MNNRILTVGISLLLLASCNDDFLEKYPGDKFTNNTFWKSETDFRSYAFGLYNWQGFGGYNEIVPNNSDEICLGGMARNNKIFGLEVVPASGGAWNWSQLRKINIMVEHAKTCDLEPAAKNHWLGIARFFRAKEYFEKVKLFNDVPWVGKELNVSDEILFSTQDPRALVMDSVLADLNYAVENIRIEDGANTVNKNVALALKSEICLFEGAFRKYHTELGLTDSERWFKECISASEEIMNSNTYQLDNYQTLYSSLNLHSNPEVILFKEYELGLITNAVTRMVTLGDVTNVIAGTKDAIESYLCKDGLPIGISPLHPKALEGKPELIEEEFKDRDPRLTMNFVIPYENNNPAQLPAMNISQSPDIPPFMPAFLGEGYIESATGYHPYKFWNPESSNFDLYSGVTDYPLYTYNKILLNYAEAKAEIGECDDEVLNKSINLLRQRADMPNMTIAQVNSYTDPRHTKYAPEISKLLWEIRRERQVELMFTGSRYDDIVRWKKASWLGKPYVGGYVDLEKRPAEAYDENGKAKMKVMLGDREGNPLPPDATKGYILPYEKNRQPNHKDDDLKLYYTPIAKNHLVLNPNLKQSPGWE